MTDFQPNPSLSYIQSGNFEKLSRQILIEQQRIEKFEALIAKALLPVKKRIAVKVSKAEKEKRLAEKKLLSEKKQLRKKPIE